MPPLCRGLPDVDFDVISSSLLLVDQSLISESQGFEFLRHSFVVGMKIGVTSLREAVESWRVERDRNKCHMARSGQQKAAESWGIGKDGRTQEEE